MKLTNLNVLVIEDIKPMLDLISGVLESLGVGEIHSAISGVRGLELVKKNNPDIILLDWEMPELDGIEFTKEIRTNVMIPSRTVPIILITGYNAEQKILKARESGVTEYIVKPFTAQQLAKRLEHVINNPRDFIEADTYVGPDRRRKQDKRYKGPMRRSIDKE